MNVNKPQADEYAPYYGKYISLVPAGDVISALETQAQQTGQLLATYKEDTGDFRYAPDKWTIKEVIGHVADTERIFTYRALRIARGDKTPLPGFEQDDYVRSGAFRERTLKSLVEELAQVRGATTALYRSLGEDAWSRRGIASEKEVTVRALAFMTAGHELHHVKILEDRYFPAIARA